MLMMMSSKFPFFLIICVCLYLLYHKEMSLRNSLSSLPSLSALPQSRSEAGNQSMGKEGERSCSVVGYLANTKICSRARDFRGCSRVP